MEICTNRKNGVDYIQLAVFSRVGQLILTKIGLASCSVYYDIVIYRISVFDPRNFTVTRILVKRHEGLLPILELLTYCRRHAFYLGQFI